MCNAHAKDYVIYDYINSIEHNECSFSDVAEHKIKIITSLTTFILTKVYFYSVLSWLVWSQCTHISANACYMDVSYLDEIDQLREMLSSHCWGCGEMLDATASSKLISDKSQIIIVIRLAAHAKPYPHFQWWYYYYFYDLQLPANTCVPKIIKIKICGTKWRSAHCKRHCNGEINALIFVEQQDNDDDDDDNERGMPNVLLVYGILFVRFILYLNILYDCFMSLLCDWLA